MCVAVRYCLSCILRRHLGSSRSSTSLRICRFVDSPERKVNFRTLHKILQIFPYSGFRPRRSSDGELGSRKQVSLLFPSYHPNTHQFPAQSHEHPAFFILVSNRHLRVPPPGRICVPVYRVKITHVPAKTSERAPHSRLASRLHEIYNLCSLFMEFVLLAEETPLVSG